MRIYGDLEIKGGRIPSLVFVDKDGLRMELIPRKDDDYEVLVDVILEGAKSDRSDVDVSCTEKFVNNMRPEKKEENISDKFNDIRNKQENEMSHTIADVSVNKVIKFESPIKIGPIGPSKPIMKIRNCVDENGNKMGGSVESIGFHIGWQDGPVKENGVNGAQVEEVLLACKARLKFLNSGDFKCMENDMAIGSIANAIQILDSRTKDRIERGVEGKNEK